MNDQGQPTVFEQIGEAGFASFVTAFYRRVPTDPILGPLYPEEDFVGAEQQLRDFRYVGLSSPTYFLTTRRAQIDLLRRTSMRATTEILEALHRQRASRQPQSQ